MNFNNLLLIFKDRCKTIDKFINTKFGRTLFFVACGVFLLLFFAPLFQGTVGAALISCVASPLVIMIWRRHDKAHAVVPAIILCIPMILDMLIYHTLAIAVCMLVAIVCTLAVAMHPAFEFVINIKDNMYAYLACGGVCAAVVVIATLLILLVSIAWWLFCLFLFLAIIAIFFTVVLSTAAYTATDDKRQARKKQAKQEDRYDMRNDYDLDIFARDIGLTSETDEYEHKEHIIKEDVIEEPSRKRKEPLYYDVD